MKLLGGIAGVARALVARNLRIRTQRARQLHAFGRVVFHVLRCEDLAAASYLFPPNVREHGRCRACRRARSSCLAGQARSPQGLLCSAAFQEPVETNGVASLLCAHRVLDRSIVVDGVQRRNSRIVPAMIENQFAAA